MDMYIFAADTFCEACGTAFRRRIRREGIAPANPRDETTYDSDEYPKGPYDSDNESSDTPSHCGSGEKCLEPTIIDGEKYGKFLENPLTLQGEAYVRALHANSPSSVTAFWMEFYEL